MVVVVGIVVVVVGDVEVCVVIVFLALVDRACLVGGASLMVLVEDTGISFFTIDSVVVSGANVVVGVSVVVVVVFSVVVVGFAVVFGRSLL